MNSNTRTRDNGDGSAYQRKSDGRWCASVTVGWQALEDGRRRQIRKVVYGATKEEVKAERNRLIRERDNGQLARAGRMTLGAWLDYWLDVICVERDLGPSTIAGYRRHVRLWIKPVIGSKRLAEVGPDEIEQVYRRMREAGRAPSYVVGCHRTLSRAFKVAMQRRKIPINPCDLLDAPTFDRAEADFFHPDEARQVVTAAEHLLNPARWKVAFAVGLRQSEALGLMEDRIDLPNRRMRIDRQLRRSYAGSGVRLAKPKSKKSNRWAPIPPQLVPVIEAQMALNAERRAALGPEWRGHNIIDLETGRLGSAPLLFSRADGRHIDHSDDWREWGALLKSAGVRYIEPHASRHTAATLMLIQGVHPRVAQEILGHASSSMFNEIYSHVIDELNHDAAEKVGEALFGPARVAAHVATPRDPRARTRKRRAPQPSIYGYQGPARTHA